MHIKVTYNTHYKAVKRRYKRHDVHCSYLFNARHLHHYTLGHHFEVPYDTILHATLTCLMYSSRTGRLRASRSSVFFVDVQNTFPGKSIIVTRRHVHRGHNVHGTNRKCNKSAKIVFGRQATRINISRDFDRGWAWPPKNWAWFQNFRAHSYYMNRPSQNPRSATVGKLLHKVHAEYCFT